MSEEEQPEGIWVDFEDEWGFRWYPDREAMVASMLLHGMSPALIAAAKVEPETDRVYVRVDLGHEILEYPVLDFDAGIGMVLRFAEDQGVPQVQAMTTLESQKMDGLAELEVGPFRVFSRASGA